MRQRDLVDFVSIPDSSEELDGEQQQKQCKVCSFLASGVSAV
jgi:hypothetical protein